MDIDTSDAAPQNQSVRRVPFAAWSEIAQQLIQKGSSPVVLVQKDGSSLYRLPWVEFHHQA